jgi:ADP-ribose pyrophosphatase YjhB (NUDIX family)
MRRVVVLGKILLKGMRPFWRMRRGLTLGARGCVVDEAGRILLIKHSYMPGWQFPGGGVEWGETAEFAAAREVKEEAGVEVTGPMQLHGLYSNFATFPGDHVALYVIRQWHRPVVPGPNAEILATGFYAPTALPPDTTAGTRRRVAELFEGAKVDANW